MAGFTLPTWLVTILRWYFVLALPLVLVLVNARVLMSNTFLNAEYNRAGFPPDAFGFSTEDRLTHAPLALDYLFNNEEIDFLGDQTFPDGSPLYNERELSHMHDVKGVTQGLTRFGLTLAGLLVISVVALVWQPATRPALQWAMVRGGIFSIVLLVVLVVLVGVSFDAFFVQFHALFFEGDSWLFLYSDTLIRLFPVQFWIDAFVLLFGGAIVEAGIIAGAAWRWGKLLAG